jgi:hypothetical protein
VQVATVPKKKPVALIAAAVGLLVLGGGGAAMVMMKDGNAPGASPPVTPNTAQKSGQVNNVTASTGPTGNQSQVVTRQAAGNPTNTATQKSSRQQQNTANQTTQLATNPSKTVPDRPRGIEVKVADADDWLMGRLGGLSKDNAAGIKDTALAFFNAPGISQKAKAFAAYGVGQAYGVLDQASEAISWARQAVQLDPASRIYQRYVADLNGVKQ